MTIKNGILGAPEQDPDVSTESLGGDSTVRSIPNEQSLTAQQLRVETEMREFRRMSEALANSETLKELQQLELERERITKLALEAADDVSVATIHQQVNHESALHGSEFRKRSRSQQIIFSAGLLGTIGLAAWVVQLLLANHAMQGENRELYAANTTLRKNIDTLQEKQSELIKQSEELVNLNNQQSEYIRHSDKLLPEAFQVANKLPSLLKDIKDEEQNKKLQNWYRDLLKSLLPVVQQYAISKPNSEENYTPKLLLLYELAGKLHLAELSNDAYRVMQEYIACAKERLTIKRHSDAARRNLALGLQKLAFYTQEVHRDFPQAIRNLTEAEAIYQAILDEPRADFKNQGLRPVFETQIDLAAVKQELSIVYLRIGNSVESYRLLEESKQLREVVRAKVKSKVYEQEFAASGDTAPVPTGKSISSRLESGDKARNQVFAFCLRRNGNYEDSLKELEKNAIAEAESLVAANNRDPVAIRKVIVAFTNWSETELEAGLVEKAKLHAKEALKYVDMLNEISNPSVDQRRAVASAYLAMAQALSQDGDSTAQCFGEVALELRKGLAETDASNLRARLLWMLCEAEFGDAEVALGIAERFYESNNQDSETLFDVARALALCSSRDPVHSRRLADQSIKALERAINIGWRDGISLARCWELRSLRSESLFAALLTSINRTAISDGTAGSTR